MRAHAENGFLLKSFTLMYTCIQESYSVSEIFAVNFMVVLNQLLLEKPQENEISRPKKIALCNMAITRKIRGSF